MRLRDCDAREYYPESCVKYAAGISTVVSIEVVNGMRC